MEKELCFKIEGKELYMVQILVEYQDVPIYYLCSDGEDYYLVLCADMEKETYIIVKPCLYNISRMLHGELAMRDIILRESGFWQVTAGAEVYEDIVERKDISEIPLADLPDEGAYFQAVSKELENFTSEMDDRLYSGSWKELHFDECVAWDEDLTSDMLLVETCYSKAEEYEVLLQRLKRYAIIILKNKTTPELVYESCISVKPDETRIASKRTEEITLSGKTVLYDFEEELPDAA